MEEVIDRMKGPWKCFHCGEVFHEYHLADNHFGMDQGPCYSPPLACILKAERPLVQYIRRYEEATTKIWNILRDLEDQ